MPWGILSARIKIETTEEGAPTEVQTDKERPDLGAGTEEKYEDAEQKMEIDGANFQGKHKGGTRSPLLEHSHHSFCHYLKMP